MMQYGMVYKTIIYSKTIAINKNCSAINIAQSIHNMQQQLQPQQIAHTSHYYPPSLYCDRSNALIIVAANIKNVQWNKIIKMCSFLFSIYFFFAYIRIHHALRNRLQIVHTHAHRTQISSQIWLIHGKIM